MTGVTPHFQHPGPPPVRPELPEGAPEPPAAPVAADGLPPLGVPVWAPFAALVAVFTAVLFASLIVGVFVGIGGGGIAAGEPGMGLTVALTVVQAALLIAVAWAAVRLLSDRQPVRASFGLRRTPWRPAVGWTLAAYAGFWVVAIVVGLTLGEPEEQQLIQDIRDEDSIAILAGLGLLSCLVAPIAEEFFFRGFMFRAIAERVHWLWAAAITGGVFGAIHLGGSPAISLLVLSAFGVALCVLFHRTGSLLPCIVLHAFNNSISFGVTKELPWWGLLLLISASVAATLAVSLAVSARRRPVPA